MTAENSLFNPFPGLRPFQYGEQYLFFGREGQSEEILRHLHSHRFLAVVGTSGSGKSSLIRAGLLPDLHGGFMASAGSHWRVAIFRPAGDPIGNLARALDTPEVLQTEAPLEDDQHRSNLLMEVTLRRSGLGLIEAVRLARLPEKQNVLVIVDQFEELFRFANTAGDSSQADDAAGFVKLLLEATQQSEVPIYVVITMRSDFIGDCARFRDLPEAVTAGMYLIPRMSREQRRHAIEDPVGVGGGKISLRLVNRLLNEVGDNPDQLPILQHALMRTWDDWARPLHNRVPTADAPIDITHFDAIGGLDHALSNHADEAYDALPSDRHRVIARKMFQGLTERGEDNREVRRPITVTLIAAIADAKLDDVFEVIEAFQQQGRSFLTTSSKGALAADSVIDISHESLIRLWVRLRNWVEEESEAAHIYKRLAEDAALHAAGRTSLWHDPALQNALDWRKEFNPTEEWASRYSTNFDQSMAFLAKSCEARATLEKEKERQRTAELRRTRRNLVLASVAVVFLLVIAASAVIFTIKFREISRVSDLMRGTAESAKRAAQVSEQKALAARDAETALRKQAELEGEHAAKAEKQAIIDRDRAQRAEEKSQQDAAEARRQTDVATEAKNAAKEETKKREEEAKKRKEDRDALNEYSAQVLYHFNDLSAGTKTIKDVRALTESTCLEAIKVYDLLVGENPADKNALLGSMLARAQLMETQQASHKSKEAAETASNNVQTSALYMSASRSYYSQIMGAILLSSVANFRSLTEKQHEAALNATQASQTLDAAKLQIPNAEEVEDVQQPAGTPAAKAPASAADSDKKKDAVPLSNHALQTWRLISIAYSLDGSAQKKDGQPEEALVDFKKAVLARLKTMDEYARRTPSSRDTLIAYIQDVAQENETLHHHDDAIYNYQSVITYLNAVGEAYPKDHTIPGELVRVHNALGRLYFSARADAADHLKGEAELAESTKLANSVPQDTNTEDQSLRLKALQQVGIAWYDVAMKEKDEDRKKQYLTNALHAHVESRAVDLQLAKDDSDAERQRSLIWTEYYVGRDYMRLKEFATAREYYQGSVKAAEKAVLLDQSDSSRREVSDAYRMLSYLEEEADQYQAALKANDIRIEAVKSLALRPNALDSDKVLLAEAYGSRSAIEIYLGHFDRAIAAANTGMKLDPKQTWIQINLADANLFLGNFEEAKKIYLENADVQLEDFDKTFREVVLEGFAKYRAGHYPGMNLRLLDPMECILNKQSCAAKTSAH